MSATSDLEQRLRDLLRERSITRGDFVLASGRRSTFYIDARRTTMAAEGLAVIGALALERLATLGWPPSSPSWSSSRPSSLLSLKAWNDRMMLWRTRSSFAPPSAAVAGSTSVPLFRNQPLRSRLTVSFAEVPAVTSIGGLNLSS